MTGSVAGESVLAAALDGFIDRCDEWFWERWEAYLRPATLTNAGEVMTGLLHQQVQTTILFARSHVLWEAPVAPIVLRTMIETHINLAWILRDPVPRSDAYIEYGLGQAKLTLEHRKAQLAAQGQEPDDDLMVRAGTAWLESQRYAFLTPVNVGNWAAKDLRQMADEVGEGGLYRLSYVPFSAAVHSQWYHVARTSLAICQNPLHGGHRVPGYVQRPWIIHLSIAAKYLTRTLDVIDKEMGYESNDATPLEWLNTVLGSLSETPADPEVAVPAIDTLDDGSGY